jgi:hypothetical protein
MERRRGEYWTEGQQNIGKEKSRMRLLDRKKTEYCKGKKN